MTEDYIGPPYNLFPSEQQPRDSLRDPAARAAALEKAIKDLSGPDQLEYGNPLRRVIFRLNNSSAMQNKPQLDREEKIALLTITARELQRHDVMYRETIYPLISMLPNVNRRDHDGNSFIHVAALNTRAPMRAFKLLVGRGANINDQNRERETPLLLQAHFGRAQNVARMIVMLRADPTINDIQDLSPLDHARLSAAQNSTYPRFTQTIAVLEAKARGASDIELLELAGLARDAEARRNPAAPRPQLPGSSAPTTA
jgi:ankyrin repeat protein